MGQELNARVVDNQLIDGLQYLVIGAHGRNDDSLEPYFYTRVHSTFK
jgi:hypothetical protein